MDLQNNNVTEASFSSNVIIKLQPEFVAFKKIPRLNRDVVITEKIDGTNASILVTPEGDIYAGKRTSWCTPNTAGKATDNYGFAAWVQEHKEDLLKLGPGRHFGEWWGKGINRGYGLEERRFSLFNTSRDRSSDPSCVGYVPVLYSGAFSSASVEQCILALKQYGSVAVPGWMNPEGVVIYHVAAGQLFKVTCENDEKPKGIDTL